MFDPNDNTKEYDNSAKRGIPAVPTPDWSMENYETNMFPIANTLEKMDDALCGIAQRSSQDHPEQPPVVNSTSSTSIHSDTPQKSTNTHIADIGSASSTLTRHSADVPSTPTHTLATPVYPHMSMSAATPAPASGVNQAINSIKLQNCVSTVNVGCELSLLDIYCKTRYSEYNPQRFQGVVMKLMDPRATALIFKSGKIVCTGARNEYDSYIAARKFARIIEKLGFPTRFQEFKIQNFCATADLKFPIRLEALQQAHGQFASYEPELFPGLVYRMVRPRVVLLIFVNGKIVFTGGRNRNEITEALEIIYPILRGYKI